MDFRSFASTEVAMFAVVPHLLCDDLVSWGESMELRPQTSSSEQSQDADLPERLSDSDRVNYSMPRLAQFDFTKGNNRKEAMSGF